MLIGIDFDNTIVSYDCLFYKVALERKLIPNTLSPMKSSIRDHLRGCGKEELWTKMQGYVYGKRMDEALPFDGVLEFLYACKRTEIPVCIVSHKTRYPYLGPKYRLREAAMKWLESGGFLETEKTGLSLDRIFFEGSKEAKIKRIIDQGVTTFIDDLPEFLMEEGFPEEIEKLFFNPNESEIRYDALNSMGSWHGIRDHLLSMDRV